MNEHTVKESNTSQIVQVLGKECREGISMAAALAVMLDLRPLSFAEGHEVMEAIQQLYLRLDNR